MLELSRIHLSRIYDYLLPDYEKRLLIPAQTVEDVEKIIEDNPSLNWGFIKKRINLIKKDIEMFNKKGGKLYIYNSNGYSDSSLVFSDLINKGNILLVKSVVQPHPVAFRELDDISIADIKRLLLLTDEFGNNYLEKYLSGVGPKGIERLVLAINKYEEQIERQSKLSNIPNYFEYMIEERKELVEINYSKIINYYLNKDDFNFVWGHFSSKQKEVYNSTIKGNTKKDKMIRGRLVDYFSNYLTIPELEDICRDEKEVLDRFIIS